MTAEWGKKSPTIPLEYVLLPLALIALVAILGWCLWTTILEPVPAPSTPTTVQQKQ